MSALVWDNFGVEWALEEKVSFNGFTKEIHVNSGVTTLDIMADVYSAWVRWIARETRFLPAIRYSGFDAIPGGRSGATFFLYNGWKLFIDLRQTKVLGVLFSDNYPTAYYDSVTELAIYPAEVSSVVNTVYSGGGAAPSASEIWAFNNRTLTTAFPTIPVPPTPVQIRQEIDSNSTQLQRLLTSSSTILESIDNIAIGSACINAAAVEFSLISGVVTSGSIANTRNLDHVYHVISDSTMLFDVTYLFDIGLDTIPTELVITGRVGDKHEIMNVAMWNYHNSAWEFVGTIAGSTSDNTYRFVMYQSFVGNQPGLIGDVKVRFYSTALSDVILNIDQMYVSYSVLERAKGYSGHVTSATEYTITLGLDAAAINNYYTPCLVYVNHGTGEKQYAKAMSYTGITRMLNLEFPMAVTLDTTSHITLSAWANTSVDSGAIATAVWDKPVTDLTDKTKIGGFISKLMLTIPKFLGLK